MNLNIQGDFQICISVPLKRERERQTERERESTAADRSSITIFYINAIKLKISMFRIVSTYASLVYPSCRCFFKIMNFSDRFRQCFKFFFTALRSSCYEFSGISKKILKKNSMMKSRFINVAKGRIQNSFKQLRWNFFAKIVNR